VLLFAGSENFTRLCGAVATTKGAVVDPKYVGIAWAVGAFIALQFVSFIVAILANGASPFAVRLASIFHTHWKDQRREARIEKLALLILAQRNPAREIATLIIGVAGIVIGVQTAVFAYLVPVNDPLSLKIMEHISEDGVRSILSRVSMGLSAVMMLMISSKIDILVAPKAVAARLIGQLEKQGVGHRAAWEEAKRRADLRVLRVPSYRD
jgi:hypothetical protein